MQSGKRSALFATGIAGALVLSGCGGGDTGAGGSDEGRASGQIVYGESTDFPDNLLPIISSGNATSVANILIRIQPGPFQLLPDFSVVHDPEFMTEEPSLEERITPGTPNPRSAAADLATHRMRAVSGRGPRWLVR